MVWWLEDDKGDKPGDGETGDHASQEAQEKADAETISGRDDGFGNPVGSVTSHSDTSLSSGSLESEISPL